MNRDQRAKAAELAREIRADVATIRQVLERYRDRLEAEAARRERRRRRVNRLTLGLFARR